nr:putative ORF1 [Marmot picobirnavirus]
MTRNQIEYWKLKEQQRSARVGEKETNRSNLAREGETARHNRQTERQAINELAESARSHKANEGITINQLGETRRHNVASEGLSDVINRINTEKNRLEAVRMQQNYELGQQSNEIANKNAEANKLNALTNNASGASTLRYNQAKVREALSKAGLTDQQTQTEILNTLSKGVNTADDVTDVLVKLFTLFSK